MWRTILRFAQIALVVAVLLLGRRALERLGLSSKPVAIATVVAAAALLMFGGPHVRRGRAVSRSAPMPPPLDPEFTRHFDTSPEEWLEHTRGPDQPGVRSSRSVSWRTSTGPDGHVHSEFHERGPNGQTRDRTYDGPVSGAVWKALRAVLRRLG